MCQPQPCVLSQLKKSSTKRRLHFIHLSLSLSLKHLGSPQEFSPLRLLSQFPAISYSIVIQNAQVLNVSIYSWKLLTLSYDLGSPSAPLSPTVISPKLSLSFLLIPEQHGCLTAFLTETAQKIFSFIKLTNAVERCCEST